MPARSSVESLVADGRRPDIEERLTNLYHVTWSPVHNLSASRVDMEASKKHQARFQSIIPGKVEEYAEAIINGAKMPWPIVYTAPSGKVEIADGIHRVSAFALNHLPFSVYLLDPDTAPQAISMIMAVENTRHGVPSSPQERVEWALTLIANGSTQALAAATVQADPRKVAKAVADATVLTRIKSQHYPVNKWEALDKSIRDRLKGIGTDEGLVTAAAYALEAQLTGEEVKDLLSRLTQAKRSSARQVQIIEDYAKEHDLQRRIQESSGGVRGSSDRGQRAGTARLASAVGMIDSIPDDDDAIVRAYRGPDRQQYAERLMKVSERLARVAERLLQA